MFTLEMIEAAGVNAINRMYGYHRHFWFEYTACQ